MKLIALLTAFCTQASAAPAYLGVVNKADGTVSIIDLDSRKTVSVLGAGYFPHEIHVVGDRAYVSNYGKDHVRSTSPDNKPGNTLAVLDLTFTRKKKADLEFTEGTPACAPHGMDSSPDGARLYVTCEGRDEIAVIETATGHVLHTVPTGQPQSHMIAVTRDESRAYVANFSAGSVSVLDLRSRRVLKVIPTGPGNEGVALSPDGRYVYASSVLGNRVFKIDTQTLEIVASAATDRSPVRVVSVPGGKYVLTNNSAGATVQVFDANSLNLVKTIKVGRQPIGIAVANESLAYVANMNDSTVMAIDLSSFQVTDVIQTGQKPDGIFFFPQSDAKRDLVPNSGKK